MIPGENPPATHQPERPLERVHCNDCGRQTQHAVLSEHIQRDSEELDSPPGYEISWRTRWTMLECRGCTSVCLRRAASDSESDTGRNYDEYITFFPPPTWRELPDWAGRLRDDEQALLKEVYVALQADSRRLAMMGARALVDIVMNREGDQGSFATGLNALVERGLIGTVQKDVLNAALDVGHAASHRGHQPSRDDVGTVMDIVEHLLLAEVLASTAADLRSRTPPRPPRARRSRGTPPRPESTAG